MQIRNGKDFWAGLMFVGFGLSFMLMALSYPMGSGMHMGPGYFPTGLGGMLAVLGAIVLFRAFVTKLEHPLKVFLFRPLLLVASLVVGAGTYFADSWLKDARIAEFAFTGLALALFISAFGPRAMFVILLAVVIFGYAIAPLGLVLAIVLLIVLSVAGGHDFRKKEVIILTIVLVFFCVLVFVKGLGMRFNLWPGGE
jgi:hypothetical protein